MRNSGPFKPPQRIRKNDSFSSKNNFNKNNNHVDESDNYLPEPANDLFEDENNFDDTEQFFLDDFVSVDGQLVSTPNTSFGGEQKNTDFNYSWGEDDNVTDFIPKQRVNDSDYGVQLTPKTVKSRQGFLMENTAGLKRNATGVKIFFDLACPDCAEQLWESSEVVKKQINDGDITVSLILGNHTATNYSMRAANAFITVAENEPDKTCDFIQAVCSPSFLPPNEKNYDTVTTEDLAELAEKIGVSEETSSKILRENYFQWIQQSVGFSEKNSGSTHPTIVIENNVNNNVNYEKYGGFWGSDTENNNVSHENINNQQFEEPQKKAKHRKETSHNTTVAVGAVIGVALIALGVALWFVLSNTNFFNTNKIEVAQAAEYIGHNDDTDVCVPFSDFPCTVEWVFNDNKLRGQLVEQSLTPGSFYSAGESIVLTYSKGKENVTVPNVIGLTEEDAQEQLYQAGLDVTQVSRVDSPGSAGSVVEIIGVNQGDVVSNGTKIQLNIANGNITIPDWGGKTKEFVESQAENLNVKVSFREEESDLPVGTVISQSVKDEAIAEGDAIEVVVAKSFEDKQVEIPDVLGKKPNEAQSILAELGFRKITTVVVKNNDVTETQVTQIVPKRGSTVSVDTDITIIVSEPSNGEG